MGGADISRLSSTDTSTYRPFLLDPVDERVEHRGSGKLESALSSVETVLFPLGNDEKSYATTA